MMANEIKRNNFEPSSEDTLQCRIFNPSLSDAGEWNQLCTNINKTADSIAQDYIWQRDSFRVFTPMSDTIIEDIPFHLKGSICFGDNIEDEWFIVHMLLELSKSFNDIIIQVTDSDGEFLLIEAADYLPSWTNPDSTENRVFIYQNNIHLISPQLVNVEKLNLKEALLCVVENPVQTLASPEVQNSILNRVGNYPEKNKSNLHNSVVSLPVDVAALLKLQPKLVAPLVDAYCHHDAIDSKACKTLDYQDSVQVTVKFTKCLYAMLLHSKIIKPLMYTTRNDKSTTLGKKITCGYKMIMNRSSDIYCSKEYNKFLKSLSDNGYFKGNIEGSQEYKRLLENAKVFYSSVECPVMSNVAANIKEVIESQEYAKTKESLKTCSSDLVEDNDEWLNIHPEQLNNMLNSRYGNKTKFQKNDIINSQNITKELTDFLKKTSDYEGIESTQKDVATDEIDFEPDQFVNSIEKMLKLLSTNQDERDSDSDFSVEDVSDTEIEEILDQELKNKLLGRADSINDNKSILQSMVESMKEEKAASGPSSNLMNTIGLAKTDFIDSDDD